MKIDYGASEGKRLRSAPFPFQQTYATPLPDLYRFAKTLTAPFEFAEASIWIELIVFEPKELIWYLKGLGITSNEGQLNNAVLIAESRPEAATLLECILGQWTDFVFLPKPRTFAIYADHDEYTTLFTENAQILAALRENMAAEGFEEVANWTWTGPHSPGIEGKSIDA